MPEIGARVITVALDVMGADAGIAPMVAGAAQLSCDKAPIDIVLVGDETQIKGALEGQDHDGGRLRIVHTKTFLANTDKPAAALEERPDCSILCAARLVADGEADVLVSAGNTGGVILAASRTFKRIVGVRRVGLAAVYPTIERHGPHGDPFALMLDVGATLACTADDLVCFAVMGSAYSSVISNIDRPRVALLSNGSESTKGTPEIVKAHEQLLRHKSLHFVGNVEGIDIPRGSVDVIVCSGFVGNVVLKILEGVSEAAKDLARSAYGSKLTYKLGLGILHRGIVKIRNMTDWKQYGGAPILGFDHLVIKAHGRSNARAIRNALKVAAKSVDRKLIEQVCLAMGQG